MAHVCSQGYSHVRHGGEAPQLGGQAATQLVGTEAPAGGEQATHHQAQDPHLLKHLASHELRSAIRM